MLHQPGALLGVRLNVIPDQHRELPAEVCPGVPWPPGFKAEVDAWMRGFFRPRNLLSDGQVWHDRADNVMHMNPRTFEEVKRASVIQGG